MKRQFVAGGVVATFLIAAAVLFLNAAPAHAQLGSMHGRVVDEAGNPVADADVSFDFVGEQNFHFTSKTDAKGNYNRGGLQLASGRWTVTVKKGNLSGTAANLEVPKGNALQVPDIVLRAGGAGGTGGTGKGKVDVAKAVNDAKASMAAGNVDEAIAKLTDTASKSDKCTVCYSRLGDAYLKKGDLDNAEKAYQQAVQIDDKSAYEGEAYSGLTELYNKEAADAKDPAVRQKKLDDAASANQKGMALLAASPAGALAGGDPTSIYNSAVILWNQGKIQEAEAQFQKVLQMNPSGSTLANSNFYYGLALASENKNAEAKAALQKAISAGLSGDNATMAKQILDTLK